MLVRIKGKYACFSIPYFGMERVSYPVITPSAIRNIMQSYLTDRINESYTIDYSVNKIYVIKKGNYINLKLNELGLKAGRLCQNQKSNMILQDVDYICDVFLHTKYFGKHINMIKRSIEANKPYRNVFLGMKEYVAEVSLYDSDESTINPIDWNTSVGPVLYDIVYKEDFKSDKNLLQDTPVYFMCDVINGIIDVNNSVKLGPYEYIQQKRRIVDAI